jgi:hypothetical protein
MTVMKKIIDNSFTRLLFAGIMLVAAMFVSCNNDEDSGSGPVITEVRNYAAAPNDTLVNKLVPGQWVVLKGSHLKDAVKIAFNGIAVDFNGGLFADNYAVVQVPAVIPFPSVAENDLNTIELVTPKGKVIFDIDIVAGPPVLDHISNENPQPGEEVIVYGANLFQISGLVFAGVSIQEFTGSDDGTAVSFKMPDGAVSGPLKITTGSGEILTAFNVNDKTTGVISNADDISNWEYWGGAQIVSGESNSIFPGGNVTNFFVMDFASVSGGDGQPWSHAVRIGQTQWIPAENLSDPVDNWAFKFEINVPNPWLGGSIMVATSTGNYLARYEPWQGSPTGFKTTGWQTVTIPFTQFRDGGSGKGDILKNITDLIGAEGKSNCQIYLHNYEASGIAFKAAFDNIRVVKIINEQIN